MRRIVCVNEILWKYAHSRSRSLRAARADSISGRSFILANWVISWDTQITRTLISKRLPGRMLTPQVGQNGPQKKTIDRSREFCARFLLRIQLKTDHPCSALSVDSKDGVWLYYMIVGVDVVCWRSERLCFCCCCSVYGCASRHLNPNT